MTASETPRRAANREALFRAAEALFGDYGYDAISHADIAIEAGLARTTFYEYFPSKEDLLVELVEDRLPVMAATMIAAVPRDVEPVDQLCELAARMIEFIGMDHTLGLILHREAGKLGDTAQARIAAAHADLSAEFGRLYRAGVASGRLRPLPGRLAGRIIQETIMAAGRVLLASGDPKAEVHEICDATVAFLRHGLTVTESDT